MTRISRHRVIAAAAFLAAAPALAGCGAGSDAITNQPYAPTEALTTQAKGLNISQAFFLGPDSGATIAAGAATPLYLSVVNTNQAPDQLVGIGVDSALGTAKVSSPVTLPVQTRVSIGKPTPLHPDRGAEEASQGRREHPGAAAVRQRGARPPHDSGHHPQPRVHQPAAGSGRQCGPHADAHRLRLHGRHGGHGALHGRRGPVGRTPPKQKRRSRRLFEEPPTSAAEPPRARVASARDRGRRGPQASAGSNL